MIHAGYFSSNKAFGNAFCLFRSQQQKCCNNMRALLFLVLEFFVCTSINIGSDIDTIKTNNYD